MYAQYRNSYIYSNEYFGLEKINNFIEYRYEYAVKK